MEHTTTSDTPAIDITLPDGMPVRLRPLTPDDREAMKVGFQRLSHQTRFQRFFRAIGQLTEEDIDYLTRIDQVTHVAWVMVDPNDPDRNGLALARLVRDADDPEVAEVAFVVIDEYHHRGIGTIMLALMLVRAEELGLRTLRAVVRPDNEPVLRWMRGLGAPELGEPGVVCEFDLPVGKPISRTPAAGKLERIKRGLRSQRRRRWGWAQRVLERGHR